MKKNSLAAYAWRFHQQVIWELQSDLGEHGVEVNDISPQINNNANLGIPTLINETNCGIDV